MSLTIKMLIGSLLLIGLVVLVAVVSALRLNQVGLFVQEVYDKPLMAINFSRTAQADFLTMQKVLYELAVSDAEGKEKKLKSFKTALSNFNDDLDVAQERAVAPDAKETAQKIQEAVKAWIKLKEDAVNGKLDYKEAEKLSKKVEGKIDLFIENESSAGHDFVITTQDMVLMIKKQNIIIAVISVCFGVLIAVVMSRHISVPIKKCVIYAQEIARGNFDNDIQTKRRDEIGKLLEAFMCMQSDLVRRIREEREAISQVEQEEQRKNRTAMIDRLVDQINGGVGFALQEIEGSISSVKTMADSMADAANKSADQSLQASSLVSEVDHSTTTVAAATEQLSSSIRHITEQADACVNIAKAAEEKAALASHTVATLSSASTEIGNIVVLIQTITRRVNLLALNATIEAAHAGDAGKGFVVVANEVKLLANQTAHAAESISKQVSQIQKSVSDSAQSIHEIDDIIRDISQKNNAISQAVQSQDLATSEIAENVQNAAMLVREANGNITDVASSAGHTFDSSVIVKKAADDLAEQSNNLREIVDDLLLRIRTF
jgi:methyl-accepting chemotaxis protein